MKIITLPTKRYFNERLGYFFVVRKWRSIVDREKNETRQLILPGQIDKQNALDYWIKLTQRSVYHEEITKLENEESIARSSKILQFNPFIDDKGILHVGGRLAFSHLTFEEKHPILLPKKHGFVQMLILHFHQENMHSGVDQTHFFLTHLARKFKKWSDFHETSYTLPKGTGEERI